MNLNQKIKSYSDMLIEDTKSDGVTKFIRYSDDAPYILRNAVMEAHGDRMPSDWIFKTFSGILDNLTNYEIESIDDLDDKRSEVIDSLVDSYTSNLTEWLNESPYNVEYLSEAVNELGAKDGFQILSGAQYMAIDEIYGYVVTLLENEDE